MAHATDEMVRIVFLDRDGTLNRDFGYVTNPKDLELLPEVAQGVALLHAAGWRLVVVSNQSAIGRGMCAVSDVEATNERLKKLLLDNDPTAELDAILYCPHSPSDGCECRKPHLGMLKGLPAQWKFDPQACWVIGDKLCDLEFGANLGIPQRQRILLIDEGKAVQIDGAGQVANGNQVSSLLDAAKLIVSVPG